MYSWKNTLHAVERLGEIEQCIGLQLVAHGPPQAFIGELCDILDMQNNIVMQAEVVGFEQGKVFLMPFTQGRICMGYKVRASGRSLTIAVSNQLLGRVIDALGTPLDNGKPYYSQHQTTLHPSKINPFHREPISERLSTGIHAIDALLPLGKGQRIGLFAGSGVGKSVLLGMIAKHINSEVNVIALIGERGREVNDFIQNNLNAETLAKSVVIVACSDDFALMRKQAVYTATAIAEYFCNIGKEVMLFMDSITRFAMAQREISLSLGEPPTTRGYTPTVFSLLPAIIERAGNFKDQGSITALYTVLVEGDDFNEPIADTMRSLLDGHIVLTRELAHQGHYPAIDVLQSVSRLSPQITSSADQQLIKQIIRMLNIYRQNKDLIELGAYQPGNNKELDHIVTRIDTLNQILTQSINQSNPIIQVNQSLREIIK
jgi:flagellum-specific ATP synthase